MTPLFLLLLAAAPFQEQEGPPPSELTAPRGEPKRTSPDDDPLATIGRLIAHPFVDNGRRFAAYPYADDGPYFTTLRFSQKMTAFEVGTTFGRVRHDLLSFSQDAMLRWSSGSDIRMEFTAYQEEVGRNLEKTHVGYVHLDIGGYDGPRSYDYSIGVGIGSLDSEESSEFGLSVRGAYRAYPLKPFGLRVDAMHTFFGDNSLTDLRAEFSLHFYMVALNLGVRSLLQTGEENFTGPTFGFSLFF